VSAGEIDLSWSASSDNVAVTGYIIFRDGAELTTVAGTKTTFQDTTVAAATGYVYTVQAIDAAGNASAQSGRTKAKTPAAR
jgi:chitodextrinase